MADNTDLTKGTTKSKEPPKKPTKVKKQNSLIGHTAKPVPLNTQTHLDVDINKIFPDQIILSGQTGQLDTGEIEKFTSISNNRSIQYGQIDNMFLDANVSAIAKTIVENVCAVSENGHIMWVESTDPKVGKFMNYVLNRMNVDKYLPKWSTSLVKYGDIYLKMLRESDFEDSLFDSSFKSNFRSHASLHESVKDKEKLDESINLVLHDNDDQYTYQLELVSDPSTMFELTKHDITMAYIEVPNDAQSLSTNDMLTTSGGFSTSTTLNQGGAFSYQVKRGDINLCQADDYIHGSLEDGQDRFPETINILTETDSSDKNKNNVSSSTYSVKRGKSMFYDVYKIWREKSLLESAMLLARLTKSSVFRLVKLETGNTDKTKSSQLLHQVKDMFEQKRAYLTDKSLENYNNPGPMENWVYFNVRNNIGAISVETIGGDYDPKSMVDLDWWNNKFYGSFGIPKQYFGWTEDSTGFNGGSSLTVLSSVFQQKVVYVQNALIQMITTALELYCYQKGLNGYIGNFSVKMKTPLSQEEVSARENFSNKINSISSAMSLFTDVETKSTRLAILKNLIVSLNYGNSIQEELDKEIKIALENERKAKEQAELAEQAALEGDADISEGEDLDFGDMDLGMDSAGGGDDLNMDLSEVPAAPDTPAQESFSSPTGSVDLYEDLEFLDESTDLPEISELGNGEIDFTENN